MSQVPSSSAASDFSWAGPLAIGGAALGGVLGAFGASRQNSAIKRAADLSFANIADYINQNRVDKYLNAERLARDAQVSMGAALNVAPEGQAALETIASRIVQGTAADEFSIEQESARREKAATMEERNVAAAANSQMQNPILAGLTGALGGASQGLQLGGGIDAVSEAKQVAAAQESTYAAQSQIRSAELAGQQTANSDLRQINQFRSADLSRTTGLFNEVQSNASKMLGNLIFRSFRGTSF